MKKVLESFQEEVCLNTFIINVTKKSVSTKTNINQLKTPPKWK